MSTPGKYASQHSIVGEDSWVGGVLPDSRRIVVVTITEWRVGTDITERCNLSRRWFQNQIIVEPNIFSTLNLMPWQFLNRIMRTQLTWLRPAYQRRTFPVEWSNEPTWSDCWAWWSCPKYEDQYNSPATNKSRLPLTVANCCDRCRKGKQNKFSSIIFEDWKLSQAFQPTQQTGKETTYHFRK